MAEMKTYAGSCHCGSVRFEATMALESALACNCTMCQRKGSLLTFVPESQFKLLTPDAPLTDYVFNRKMIHHLFCPTCGMHPFAKAVAPDGTPTVAVNVRCLENLDLATIKVTHYDGLHK